MLARSLPYAARVPQPLRPFIKDEDGFERLASGRARMPTVASLYCRNHPRQGAARA